MTSCCWCQDSNHCRMPRNWPAPSQPGWLQFADSRNRSPEESGQRTQSSSTALQRGLTECPMSSVKFGSFCHHRFERNDRKRLCQEFLFSIHIREYPCMYRCYHIGDLIRRCRSQILRDISIFTKGSVVDSLTKKLAAKKSRKKIILFDPKK